MKTHYLVVANLLLIQIFQYGCTPSGSIIEESDDPAYERGKSYLKVGRDQDALDSFLSVTRRVTQAPKSHLKQGDYCSLCPTEKTQLPRFITSVGFYYFSQMPVNPTWLNN